ncbi:MAG: Ig-like domain-containing protein, partial [Eubacterium sp.]|nr:Ig-like domain-containing protein [Eubacterium sp.]
SPSNPVKVDEIEKTILSIKDEKDTAGSTFTLLKAKGTPKSKKSIKLFWAKVPGAEEYIIYGNKCGKKNKYQKIATVKGTSYTAKKLKKGTYYKYTIVAVKGDEAIATSKAIHVTTDGGKKGNNTKVKLSKTKLSLNAGKSKKIKATLKYNKKVASHRKVAWESDNVSIATVKNGKITAVGKGTCYVYAYAQNGVSAKIKVTVK